MTDKQRIAELERQVATLRKWHIEQVERQNLLYIGQRITDRLFELGPAKVDLKLIAKLNAALGCDVLPIVKPKRKKP